MIDEHKLAPGEIDGVGAVLANLDRQCHARRVVRVRPELERNLSQRSGELRSRAHEVASPVPNLTLHLIRCSQLTGETARHEMRQLGVAGETEADEMAKT